MGGVSSWKNFGASLTIFGINSHLELLGILMILIEFIGAIFLILGFCTKTTAFFMFSVIVIATISNNESFMTITHAVELALVLLSLVFMGSGKYTVSQLT